MAKVALFKCVASVLKNPEYPREVVRTHTFEAELHCAQSPREQLIEAAFYMQWEKKVHGGVHHEMMLTRSPALVRVNPQVPIHVHQNPLTKKHFVYYTPQVGTAEQAAQIPPILGGISYRRFRFVRYTDGITLTIFHMDGFKQFILRGNVVDLAVGVVIGASFGKIVDAMVKDLLTPLIGAIVQAPDFSGLMFTINGSQFMYGDFINAFISFLIVAVAVYFFVVLPVNTLLAKMKKADKPADPSSKKCAECMSDIPLAAKRCAFCTSQVA